MTTLRNQKNAVANITETGKPSGSTASKVSSRRKFLGQVGVVLTGGAVFGKGVLASAQSNEITLAEGIQVPRSTTDPRIRRCFAIRLAAANDEARVPAAPQTTNGDEAR
ncbi:MAG TPA: hypothetical protein VGI59_08630, partial [Candidatus Udaeobacter sp.]